MNCTDKILMGGQKVTFWNKGSLVEGTVRFIGEFKAETGNKLHIAFGDRCIAERDEIELHLPVYEIRES